MKMQTIISYLEERFPVEYAEDFDNIGLLCGRYEKDVSKILVCLDCDKNVVREAVSLGAEMIVTHHPVIFDAVKSISDSNAQGEMLLSAIENGISIYSAHTNLDSAPGGLTDFLCAKIGLTPYAPLEEKIGRICTLGSGETVYSLCEKLKRVLGLKFVNTTAHEDRPIKTAAVCNGGGGGSTAQNAIFSGADVYITGDLKHHEIREIFLKEGIDYVEVRHHESEILVCRLLKDVLCEKFGESVVIEISKTNINPLLIV